MDFSLIPRELVIFFYAAVGGVALGAVTARLGTEAEPVWPVRLYLSLLSFNQPQRLKRYVEGRKRFAFREQLLASSFIWFFILFGAGLYIFGCGRRGC